MEHKNSLEEQLHQKNWDMSLVAFLADDLPVCNY